MIFTDDETFIIYLQNYNQLSDATEYAADLLQKVVNQCWKTIGNENFLEHIML